MINEFITVNDGTYLKYYNGSESLVEIPDGVSEIGEGAFRDCKTLIELRMPSTLRKIGSDAFFGCSYLKKLAIPESVAEIGEGAFKYCESIIELKMPQIIKIISKSTFEDCRKLKDLVIPNGVTEIGEAAFGGCQSLTKLEIPASVKKIGNYAFAMCRKLNAMVIPESVTELGYGTFTGCKNLTKIEIPSSVREIGSRTFADCRKLKDLIIPEGITEIGDFAFERCDAMEKIRIPGSATIIGKAPFISPNWQDILVDEANPVYRSIDGVLFELKGKEKILINYPGARKGTYRIPNDTTCVRNNAFQCSNLSVIEIPHGVELMYGCFELDKSSALEDCSLILKGTFLQDTKKFPNYYERYFKHADKTPLDLAYVALYQSEERIEKALDKELKKKSAKFIEVVDYIALIIEQDENESTAASAVEFILQYYTKMTRESLKKIYDIMQERKSPSIEALKVDWRFNIMWYGENYEENLSGIDIENDPIEIIVSTNWQYSDQIKKLDKMIVKGLKYASTEKISSKEAVIFVIASYAQQMIEKPKNIGDYQSDFVRVEICPLADQVAAAFEQDALLNLLQNLAYKADMGFLLPFGRYASGAQITQLISNMNAWKDWNHYAATGRSNIIVARGALMLSETREAMMSLDKDGLLAAYAGIRGTDEETLRDTVLSEFGLNEYGETEYDLGGKKITATLNKDLTLILYDSEADKYVKSIPKKGADIQLFEKASKNFTEIKKNLKKVVKGRNDILFADFISGKARDAASWEISYIGNPVLRQVAELIVWNQKKDTFTVTATGIISSDRKSYEIKEDIPVGVAHPIEMEKDDLKAWQQYFCEDSLKQPFEQIWEPAINRKNITKERYEGDKISVYRVMGQQKHGIEFVDDRYDNEIGFYLSGCKLQHERTVPHYNHMIEKDETFTLGKFSFVKYTRQVNHIVSLFDKWTVSGRIYKDDPSVIDLLDSFTFAQIMEFINLATKSNSTNCAALLLNYKNEHFRDFNPMSEFTLD